ncbi:MAG TPA: amino acid adenylation domain-containing protein [Actinospica sp.]|jgi:amino acid adenylation domain-containing protein|nr:amino acid adenylation domain-containing protein [Actinospica sp.]
MAASSSTIPERFDAVAAAADDRIALVESVDGRSRSITYRELRDRADALAATLVARGVRPEDRVALHLDRSIEQIVAMLAVLKAGAAYVPVSTDYPDERVRQLLADSGAEVVLTRPDVLDAVAAEHLHVTVPSDAAAYVMYTSGSTGRPKGVVVTHRNLLNLVTDQSFSHFGPDETFLQLSPGSFDAAAYEIWGALLSGARLVLAGPTYQAIDEFEDTVRQHRVTAVFLTAALFHELVRGRPTAFTGLRRVVVGGDVLSPVRAAEFLALTDGPELVNGYGPTETTTFALTHLVTTPPADGASVPIGTALRNARAYLLDERLEPVAAGEIGDLWIGGDGVTRGYLGQPGRTATVYLPDPFATEPGGARMYRTGDRGRLLADGTMEFLGRADDQVKVRGFRVEPGEIEQALLSHVPGVADAAVVARQDADGARYLVAHLVPKPGHGLDTNDVRAQLASVLPAYLLPTRYVVTAALPLSPSGKIDRAALRALPEPTTTPAAPAPSNEVTTTDQQALADVWAKVLGRADVGVDDDFFALGGDSILAIRAIADAEAAGLEISLAEMFSNPRISALLPGGAPTPAVPQPQPRSAPAEIVETTADLPEGIESAYPATRLQLGLIFEAMGSPDRSLYHDVMAHRVDARLDPEALRRAVEHVAARHEILRTRFDLAGGADGPRQLVEREPRVEVTVRDWRGLSAKLQEAALDEAATETGRPFDVEEGPLIRYFAAHLDDDSFRLVYGFHHAIMDGWSDTVLLTDLMTAYGALLDGKPLPDPTPAHRYADFVRLERETLTSDAAHAFWTERASELPAVSRPANSGAPARGRRSADRIRISHPLPAGLRADLERASAQTRIPVKSLVVAAHLTVLGQLEGTAHPVSGIAVNGRPEVADADRLVGLFLNMVPIDAEVTGRSSWADVARQVFQAESALMEHRRFPYPALRELAGRPLFNTLINFTRFHLWNELSGDGAGIRLSETRSWDKTSFPLVVEAILDAVAADMRIDVTADSTQWETEDLERIWALHLQALTALTRDPNSPAHVEADAVTESESFLAPVIQAIAEILETNPAKLSGSDTFIGLGGTSLVAIAAASRLQSATGRTVTTADVLSASSLAELADVVARATPTTDADDDTSKYGAQTAPLAPAQTAIWTHQQVSKDPQIYLEHVCYEIRGAVNSNTLIDAVERALAAHPVLGGAIETVNGTPRLALGRHTLKVESVTPARQPLSEAELRAVVERESLEGIDLDGGPLLRCVLIPTGDDDRRLLLLVWHHLVMDGYSLRVLLSDIESCYADARRRPTPAAFTTCDLNLRQLARVATPESATRVRTAADRVSHLNPLPLTNSTAEGTSHTLVVSERLGRVPGLGAAATAAGYSIPVLISAAYQRAVGEVFGLGDFLTGCVTSGRVSADEESVVGCFANTVLLAGNGAADAPTDELLRRSAAELVRGLRDQDLPFTSVAGQLLRDVRPRPRYFPQLYLSMDVASPLRLRGLTTSRYRTFHDTQAKFDAALILEYGPDGVCGMVQYRKPTLSQGTAEALVEALIAQLCAITDTITEGNAP